MASNGLEQIDYRLDEIAIRIADLNARLLERQTQRAGLNIQISALSVEAVRQENFEPTSSASGIVWEASLVDGTNVSAGQPIAMILDCSRRFLEVTLSERHFESIPAGTFARVKLNGSGETFSAKVIAAYGSGARPNTDLHAASSRPDATGGFRVIVGLNPVDVTDNHVARSFCDVGRTAEVRFDLPESSVIARATSAVASLMDAARSTDQNAPDEVALNVEPH